MPYVKPDSERGPIGAWLRHSREAKNWSVGEVVQRLAEDHGQSIREDYYRQLEAGPNRVPSPPLMLALTELFGSEPDWDAPLRGMHRIEQLRVRPQTDWAPIMEMLTTATKSASEAEGLRADVAELRLAVRDLRREVLTLAAEVERVKINHEAATVRDHKNVSR